VAWENVGTDTHKQGKLVTVDMDSVGGWELICLLWRVYPETALLGRDSQIKVINKAVPISISGVSRPFCVLSPQH
jgi:hypothetical protein